MLCRRNSNINSKEARWHPPQRVICMYILCVLAEFILESCAETLQLILLILIPTPSGNKRQQLPEHKHDHSRETGALAQHGYFMIYMVYVIYTWYIWLSMGVGDRRWVRSATQGGVRHAQRSMTILGLVHALEVVLQGMPIVDCWKHHASRYFRSLSGM